MPHLGNNMSRFGTCCTKVCHPLDLEEGLAEFPGIPPLSCHNVSPGLNKSQKRTLSM